MVFRKQTLMAHTVSWGTWTSTPLRQISMSSVRCGSDASSRRCGTFLVTTPLRKKQSKQWAARLSISFTNPCSSERKLSTPWPNRGSGPRSIWDMSSIGHITTTKQPKFSPSASALFEKLVTGSSKCLFTQSRIWYSVGLVHRQNYKYEIAKEAFIKSIEFAWSELQSKDAYDTPQKARETRNQPAKYLRARALTDFCVAKSLALGLGWIFFTESALEIARSFVIAAKILLAGTKDRIITGYVNVIYAGIQRSEHADDEQALGEAIKELQNSYNLFSKNDEHEMHAAYKMRAALELALAHLQGFQCGGLPDLNALNVAEDFAKEGESLAGSDERWMCNNLVLQSRIHRLRGRADLALDAARVALEKGNKEVFLRIDAWIAQGEARAASSPPDHRGAIDDFSKALDQGRQNPKVSAVCHLHLAKMYLALGDVRSAVAHFGDSET